MYLCNQCGRTFNSPKNITDEQGDEQYESCPHCDSDDFNIKPEENE
jgi:DNA-directed RNA polymerase subunit RPC12/RpoP